MSAIPALGQPDGCKVAARFKMIAETKRGSPWSCARCSAAQLQDVACSNSALASRVSARASDPAAAWRLCMRPTLIGAIDVKDWWHRSWQLARVAALLMWALPSTSALADACEVETATLRAVASGIQVSIDAPRGNTADGSMHVSWRADQRMPLKTPTYIAIAIPGDVRFRVA